MDQPSDQRALRPKTAARQLDISLSTFWEWARKDPSFPKIFKLGPGTSAIWEHELQAWARKKSTEPLTPRTRKPGPGRPCKAGVAQGSA